MVISTTNVFQFLYKKGYLVSSYIKIRQETPIGANRKFIVQVITKQKQPFEVESRTTVKQLFKSLFKPVQA